MRREDCIAYQNGEYWVERCRRHYQVWRPMVTVCEPDSAYPPTADGLTLAIARVDYLARREQQQ